MDSAKGFRLERVRWTTDRQRVTWDVLLLGGREGPLLVDGGLVLVPMAVPVPVAVALVVVLLLGRGDARYDWEVCGRRPGQRALPHLEEEGALVDDAGAAGRGAVDGPAGRRPVVVGHVVGVVDHDAPAGCRSSNKNEGIRALC